MDQLNVVSLNQAKMWLRLDLDYDYEDALITSLIKSAVNQVEQYTLQVLWQRQITEITDRNGSLKIYNYFLLYSLFSIHYIFDQSTYIPLLL